MPGGPECAIGRGMVTWLTILTLAVIIAALAAITGAKPNGTRPVAGTHLMGAARVVLFLAIILVVYFAIKAYNGA